MIKLIADTSAVALARRRLNQASGGLGERRVTGRHVRLSAVSRRQRSGEATFTQDRLFGFEAFLGAKAILGVRVALT
jgi:hypothetical protein